MRGVVVAVEQYEVSTFCAKKCFFSKVQIHKNHNSLKKYHSRSKMYISLIVNITRKGYNIQKRTVQFARSQSLSGRIPSPIRRDTPLSGRIPSPIRPDTPLSRRIPYPIRPDTPLSRRIGEGIRPDRLVPWIEILYTQRMLTE